MPYIHIFDLIVKTVEMQIDEWVHPLKQAYFHNKLKQTNPEQSTTFNTQAKVSKPN